MFPSRVSNEEFAACEFVQDTGGHLPYKAVSRLETPGPR